MTLRRVATLLVALGLTAGLLGAGVSASYSDGGSATENVAVGTFGCRITSSAEGAVVAPDGRSVTYTAPMILSSAAGQRSFDFAIESTGSIPTAVHVGGSTPTAPFTSILGPVDFALTQGQSHPLVGGLAWPELVNDSLGRTISITYTAVCGEVPAPTPPALDVTPTAPTTTNESCLATGDGGYTIPAVAGVSYFVDAAPATSGFHAAPVGTYVFTATANAGYQLIGYPAGGWTLAVTKSVCAVNVTPTAPTKTNESCFATGDGGYTIPAVAGVSYFVGDDPASSGFHLAPIGTYVVTATANAGYQLIGYPAGGWTLAVTKSVCISFVGVASAASSGYSAANTVALPAGWQPGDMAIVFATNGPTATAPVVPAGWTVLAGAAPSATYTGSGTNNTTISAVSRVGSRVLQAGDTDTGIWTNARRIAVVVYRNVGSVGPATSTGAGMAGSVSTKYITFPALTASPGSWLVGLGYLETTIQPAYWTAKTITAPAGTINRTANAAAATSTKLAVIDSNGATTGWTSQMVTSGFTGGTAFTSAAMNGITLELKVATP